MSKEAMKLALETLEVWKGYMPALWDKTDEKAIIALREALNAPLAEQPAQQALDKMAENARELGLDYEPAQQEPVAWVRNLTDPQPHCVTALKYMSVADTDAGVQYTPLFTSPPAQRTWQGLTDEDRAQCVQATVESGEALQLMSCIEAKLKERNT